MKSPGYIRSQGNDHEDIRNQRRREKIESDLKLAGEHRRTILDVEGCSELL